MTGRAPTADGQLCVAPLNATTAQAWSLAPQLFPAPVTTPVRASRLTGRGFPTRRRLATALPAKPTPAALRAGPEGRAATLQRTCVRALGGVLRQEPLVRAGPTPKPSIQVPCRLRVSASSRAPSLGLALEAVRPLNGTSALPIPAPTARLGGQTPGTGKLVKDSVLRVTTGGTAPRLPRTKASTKQRATEPSPTSTRPRRTKGITVPPARATVAATTCSVAATAAVGAVIDGHGASALLNIGGITGMASASCKPAAPVQAPDPTMRCNQ